MITQRSLLSRVRKIVSNSCIAGSIFFALASSAFALENWKKVERLTPSDEVTNADELVFKVTFVNAHTVAPTASDFTILGDEDKQDADNNTTVDTGSKTTASVTQVTVDSGNSSIYHVTLSGGDLASYNGVVSLLPASNRIKPEVFEAYYVSNGTTLPASDKLMVFDYADQTSELSNGNFGATAVEARANADAMCKSKFIRKHSRLNNKIDSSATTAVSNGPVKAHAVMSFTASDDIASLDTNYSMPNVNVYNSGGVKLADTNWDDFVNGTLSALNSNVFSTPSDILENSGNVKYFWSFSESNGTLSTASNCSGGTSSSSSVKGIVNQNGSWYALIGSIPCNNAINFICVAWHESAYLDANISNTAPTISNLPTSFTVTEDVATTIDLSAVTLADGEDDNLTVTLALDSGTIASTDGNGTVSSVTVAGSGTASMTLSGSAAALNTYLDVTTKLNITTAADATTAMTLTVTPNDGTVDGSAATSTVNVTAVNDKPTFTSTAVTASTEDSVYKYSVTTSDPDKDAVTVSVSASTPLPSWLSLNTSTEATVSTLAGQSSGYADGTGTAASFKSPYDVVTDSNGNVYVADYGNHVIRKITPEGVVTTLAGSGSAGSDDGTGSAASFNFPKAVTLDSSGNVYVADSSNNTIRKVTPAGVVTTFAGSGTYGSDDGTGTAATFAAPTGITIDSNGNLYVVETNPHIVRKITPAGVVTTFAGSKNSSGFTDATGTSATFNFPYNGGSNSNNDLFIADRNNHAIRKITSASVVTTFAGTGSAGSTNGTGTQASFNKPYDVAADSADNLYVTEQAAHTIRKITSTGVVTTYAGSAGASGNTDGLVSVARFSQPYGIAVDSNDVVYVADTGNHRIRKISPAETTLTGTPTNDDVGDHYICLIVSDGSETSEQCFTITVTNVNDAPVVATNTGLTLDVGTTINITNSALSASDVDDSGTGLTYTVTTLPSHGSLFVDANSNDSLDSGEALGSNGTFTQADIESGNLFYTHDDSQNASDSFVFSLEDGLEDGITAITNQTFSFVVVLNKAPVISGTPTATVNENVAYNFTPTATDEDNDTLTFSITNKPSWATFSTSTGSLTGTPSYTDAGAYNGIVITVSDGTASDTLNFDITVVNVNRTPSISGTPATSVDENSSYSFTPTASDPDGDTLTFSITNKPSWATFSTSTGALSGTPSFTDAGDYNGIVVTVSDGSATQTLSLNISVVNVNRAPSISGTPSTSVLEGNVYNFIPTASDSDNDNLSFSIANQPGWASFSSTTGALTGIPDFNQSGTYSDIVITVSDGSATQSLTFSITVNDVNRAPIISGTPPLTVNEGVSYSFTPSASDEDNDNLTFSITNAPDWATFSSTTGTLAGTPTFNDGGEQYNITIRVSDGIEGANLNFSLSVVNINRLPTISGTPGVKVTVGETYSFIPAATDEDEDTLNFTITNKPSWAIFSASTGELSGTPSETDIGTTSGIQISVSDGTDNASLPAFNLEVVAENTAPTGENLSLSVKEDTSLTILPTLQDAEDDTLTLTIGSQPTNGSLTSSGTGWVYQPEADFNGDDSFTYSVSDGELQSDSYTVTLTITAVNDLPIANNDNFQLDGSANNTFTLNVLANDTDVDGDTLIIEGVKASLGSASVVDNALQYTAPSNFAGAVTLNYAIRDGHGGRAKASVLLEISGAVNGEPPVVTAPADLEVNATGLFTKVNLGTATALNSSGEPLPVTLTEGKTIFAPGVHNVYWQATDANGNLGTDQQLLRVNPLVSLSKDKTIAEGTRIDIQVLLNGPAPQYPVTVDYTVTGSAISGVDHDLSSGSVTINSGTKANISIQTVADGEFEGDETITVSLNSGVNLGAKRETTITVSEQNIAPEVSLVVTQNDQNRLTVSQDEGTVSVVATVSDPNVGDTVASTWKVTGMTSDQYTEDTLQLSFNPQDLQPGTYKVTHTATDSSSAQDSDSVFIQVTQSLQQLSDTEDTDGDLIPDSQEGYADDDGDGIPDFQDAITECNVMPQEVVTQDGFLVEGNPGVCLRKGEFTASGETGGLLMTDDEGNSQLGSDDDAQITGGLFDFIAYGLPKAGQVYQLVMPQRLPIPRDAVYRKFKASSGLWVNFVEDANNLVFSAEGEPGICPPPGDENWSSGLTEGHWCVQLQIEDGGINDDDGEANGSIVDPGGVGVLLSNNQMPVALDDTISMKWNTNITIDVLANDTDADGDMLTIANASASFGEVQINSDNTLYYTPNAGYVGVDTLNYAITDGNGGTAGASVVITVVANTAPITVSDVATVVSGKPITINVLANDSDSDGDTLQVTEATAQHGSVAVNADYSLTYQSNAGFVGSETVTYTITDGEASVQGNVNITVNKAPTDTVTNKSDGGSMPLWLIWVSLALAVVRRWQATAR
ncbi:Ig-like domain-containing protein [Pseudoalteromonas piscicida]|uniref:Ig-like domain-containing protein n=1 Tax=Pseudoalteromonas piscicida TaxID=43662 RepID=UPI0032C1637C